MDTTDKKRIMKEKVAQTLGLEVEDLEGESIMQIALTYNQIVYNEAVARQAKKQQKKQAANAVLLDPYGKGRR